MFVALDSNENRIHADDYKAGMRCFCPVCLEEVKCRRGKINRPHFAHLKGSDCLWGADKDYKSEWHIRMQEYFPKDAREVRFKDAETGEVHIADVFIENENTVIEFQKSPINADEYLSRTLFHLTAGRRIVWVFDESKGNAGNDHGRFREDDLMPWGYPYNNLQFRWMRQPRKFLAIGPRIDQYANVYSVCVWIGDEGDVVHRIVSEGYGFEYVCFSFHNIQMNEKMNVAEFFKTDTEWLQEPQYKEIIEAAPRPTNTNNYGGTRQVSTLLRYKSPLSNSRGRRRF